MNREILRKKLIDLQKKPCCKNWITMWVDKIYEALRYSDNDGTFNRCPECGKKFKKLPI